MLARDPDELDEDEEPATGDPKGSAAFSKTGCYRGSRKGKRSWQIGR
jgi:hypothetical protein